MSTPPNEDIVTATVGIVPAVPARNNYIEAEFPVDSRVEPHETPVGVMIGHVVKIVEIEGPLHLDEITARIRILWGLGRAGSRIRAAVERAAETAARQGLVAGGPFYTIPGQSVLVRDRSRVASPSIRKPEMLPPTEIDKCILEIVTANFGARPDELILAGARALGFAATSSLLKAVFVAGVERLIQDRKMSEKDGLLQIA